MSVPVYSSSKKNWFHIQPRLERLRGTPLASCPVSPVDPLRPPVVLRRALRPCPGEPRKAVAHSTTKTHSLRLSMLTLPQPSGLRPQVSLSSGLRSECQVLMLEAPEAETAPQAPIRQETAPGIKQNQSVSPGEGGGKRQERQQDKDSFTLQRSRDREPSSKVLQSLLSAAKSSLQNKP